MGPVPLEITAQSHIMKMSVEFISDNRMNLHARPFGESFLMG